MPSGQKIVAHFQDGKIVRGYSNDFLPNKDIFRLTTLQQTVKQKPMEVRVSMLKAVFFVKSFIGNKDAKESLTFSDTQRDPIGDKVVVHFNDGEVLYGYAQGYAPNRPGFFLFPIDPISNNFKAYVVLSAVKKVDLHSQA